MSQKIVSLDGTILNSIQSCARKTKYQFVDHIQTVDKAEALENGDLMHKMLEIYYTLRGNLSTETPVFSDFLSAGIIVNPEDPILSAVRAGRYFASKMDLPTEIIEECIFQFQEYVKFYNHDSLRPLAVEEVGSKVLFDGPELKIVYNFKIDVVMEQGNLIIPMDHKTSRRRQEPTSLSNQFIGYCFGLNTQHIMINKIGFQKTLKPAERFQRIILTYNKERIEEWIENTIYWVQVLQEHIDNNFWPQNFTSCDKYSGCIYNRICEKDPESRSYLIERDYKTGEAWDVASILEAPKDIIKDNADDKSISTRLS